MRFVRALMVTPIGEFAFIIAQLGVSAGMLSSDYYPIAVGVALFTALVSPVLIRHSGPISDVWLKAQPKFFYTLLGLYQQFLASVGEHQRRSRIFGLARRSLPPLAISVTFASGIFIVAPFLFAQWNRMFPSGRGSLAIPSLLGRHRCRRGWTAAWCLAKVGGVFQRSG